MVKAATLLVLASGATAAAGSVVAWLAYQGYRRNDSRAMRFLAFGVACIAVLPFTVTYGFGPLLALSDAGTLLVVLVANIAGLLAVLYSLEGT